ncbi:hypothetical protein FB451DRAFT_1399524 [Mycena latifolia]|nr:hypothetical protein FB451DRAFT_1399524 [Mycena latifolia]
MSDPNRDLAEHGTQLGELAHSDKTGASNSDSEELAFPEGGRDAWLVVLGGFVLSMSTFGYAVSPFNSIIS